MTFNLIMTVAGIGILVATLASVLQSSGRAEMSQFVILMGVIVCLSMVVAKIAILFTQVKDVFGL